MSEPVTPLTTSEFEKAYWSTRKESYFWRVLVGLDIFSNVIFGGNEDETISTRMARWDTEWPPQTFHYAFGRWMCQWLAWLQQDHGALAEAGDLNRAEEEIKTLKEVPTVKAEEGK